MMIQTQTAQTLGAYEATQIDVEKALADIRVIDIDGTATVVSRVALSGRGIKARATAGTYEVSKAALAKLEKTHTVISDF